MDEDDIEPEGHAALDLPVAVIERGYANATAGALQRAQDREDREVRAYERRLGL